MASLSSSCMFACTCILLINNCESDQWLDPAVYLLWAVKDVSRTFWVSVPTQWMCLTAVKIRYPANIQSLSCLIFSPLWSLFCFSLEHSVQWVNLVCCSAQTYSVHSQPNISRALPQLHVCRASYLPYLCYCQLGSNRVWLCQARHHRRGLQLQQDQHPWSSLT